MIKLLSVLLCLIMVLSTLSFSVSAADAQTVADSISVDTITTETANLITKNLALPTEIDGQSVTWSSNSDAVTNTGVVTRHATEEKAVTLTATVGDVTKEINLTVAPLTTMVIYQNNFGKQLNGTAFDTSKELIGATVAKSQIANWTMSTAQNTAPFGTTVGETGGILLDLNTRANSPTFTFPETMDSPFYVQFDVIAQSTAPGIDFRFNFTPEGGASTLQMAYRWNGASTYYLSSKLPSSYGGTNFASTQETKTTMRMYIDPINLKMKFMDAKGNMVPAAGIKLGDATAKNGKITTMNFCRAGSTSPAGYIEFDNFAVYRTADETQIYNDRILLGQLAENVKFADFSSEDDSSVTANLDLGTFKNKIETENPGVIVSYNSSNEEILAIDGDTGVITRPFDDATVRLEVVFSKGDSKFGKTIEFTVEEAFNPAKQVANEIIFEMISDDAINAVTGDLDLSIDDFYALDVAEGAEVSFTSSDEEVLRIDGETGCITQGTEKKDVTLTATVTKDGRTFAKEFVMTVLPEGTYVYESENFGYPELVGESIGAHPRWVIENNYSGATYADVKKDNRGYYLETARVKSAGGYDAETFSFAGIRKTKKFTVEFDLSMDSIPSGVTHDVHFLGVKEGGLSISDTTKDLFNFRITTSSLRVNGAAGYEKTIKEGGIYRLRFDFDFENETFDYYFNGALVKGGIAWKTAGDYEALSYINFRSYRASANFKIGVDNLAVYAENPEFLASALDEEVYSERPLTVSTAFDSYYQTRITADYDENQYLRVGLVEKLETFTNNPIIDFGTAELVDKNTGKKTSLNGYYSSDETNPQLINGLYIGSNHGAMGARVTSNNHGKTQADVGSVWTDANGIKWDLIRVEDANKLFFLQQKNYNLATTNFGFSGNIAGPLTYVSDGVNTGSITVNSSSATQTFPSIANVEHTFYLVRDGEMIEFDNRVSGVSYKADEVVVVEEYDIINPASIAPALRQNKPDGGYVEAPSIAVGEPIFHYKQTLTVKADGTIFTEIDHEVLTDLNSYETYGYQFYQRANPYGGGAWRQVPGTKEFTDGKGVNWDITTPYEYTNVPGTAATNLPVPKSRTLKKADWIDSDVVPSRILDFIRDEDGKNVMGYMTGFLPIYDGEPSVRKTKTNSNIYMYDEKAKAYPIFVSSSGIADKTVLTAEGSRIHGVSYRKYVDLTGFEKNNTQYYTINHENMTYYYVDFIEAGTQTLDLEKSGCIYDLTKVESIGNITYKQIGDKIVVTSEDRGYLVLKATRQLDVESAYIKDEAIYARFVNYSDSSKTVNVMVASYDGNKLVDVKAVKNVTIGANAVLNKELEASLESGSRYKIFVVSSESDIVPVSKDMTIEIR